MQIFHSSVFLLILGLLAGPAPAQARETLAHYNLDKQLAIDGYDPVAYFPKGGGEPAKGEKSRTHAYRGVTYRFTSDKNLALFQKDPARFEPAYGGWCAYAMAKGDRVEIDPKSFLIQDGRLLLFYKSLFANTRKSWQKEGAREHEVRADAEWKRFSGELGRRDTTPFDLGEGGLAIAGHDPVAYFDTASKAPALGSAERSLTHRGALYRFVSDENRSRFATDPGRFEPAYGGWCAFAMSEGKKVPVDPSVFESSTGRLYLFYNPDAKAKWESDTERRRADADRNWKGLRGES